MTAALLDVHALRQSFPRADGGEHLVLDGVELSLTQGQIVGLLGRTGSGKSTLLRLIAGLAQPSSGTITYLGEPVNAPAPGIAMVFQSFALFPWLTVLENVQLGLEALGLPEAEIRKRALGRRQATDQGCDYCDPQYRGGGADVRPHPVVLHQSGPHHQRDRRRTEA